MASKKTPQSEAVMRLVQANLHLAKGSARATIVGLEQFARRLEHETLLNPNLAENGFVAGAVAGWSAAMHEGSRLLEEAFTQWLGWSDATFAANAFKKPRGK